MVNCFVGGIDFSAFTTEPEKFSVSISNTLRLCEMIAICTDSQIWTVYITLQNIGQLVTGKQVRKFKANRVK